MNVFCYIKLSFLLKHPSYETWPLLARVFENSSKMKFLLLIQATSSQLCSSWPPVNCDSNSCVGDAACGPSLRCLESRCVIINCDTFGDSACPIDYRCLDGGCVRHDFNCDRFNSKCLNTSLTCIGSTCVDRENIVGQTTTTSSSEPTEVVKIPRGSFNALPSWAFYVFLPIGLLFIGLYIILSKSLHREYDSTSRMRIPRWIATVFNQRGRESELIQPTRNFRLTPDYLVEAYLPPASSDCTTIVQNALSIRSFETDDIAPNPEVPMENPISSLILHVDTEESIIADSFEIEESEPLSPRTITSADDV